MKESNDILTLFESLNSHEVFTPPRLARQILSELPEKIWSDPSLTFLDPCTKSGVFLREAMYLLFNGLLGSGEYIGKDDVIYNLNDPKQLMKHILKNMLFGIATSELTGYVSRRTLYGVMEANTDKQTALIDAFEKSKNNNEWSEEERVNFLIRNKFNDYYDHKMFNIPEYEDHEHEGNIFYPHKQVQKRIIEGDNYEIEDTYYPFIQDDCLHSKVQCIRNGDMKFDVIIGNPPYQITGGGGGFATPVYHKFVEMGLDLNPRYLCMITPSRWLAGGHGLNNFRKTMLEMGSISTMVDYPISSEVFAGVEIKGGVSYFLIDHEYQGETEFTTVRDGVKTSSSRKMNEFDVFVRDVNSAKILNKVLAKGEPNIASILTAVEPFKWASNFKDYREEEFPDSIPLHFTQKGKRGIGFVSDNQVVKNTHLVNTWKVLVPKAGSGGGMIPDLVLGKSWVATNPSVCTGSFMFFYLESEIEAINLNSYYKTKFFRFLVSLRKITQDAIRSTYLWVPMLDFNESWDDKKLYDRYGLDESEIVHIESLIKTMEE